MDIFWNHPMFQHKPIKNETDKYIDDNMNCQKSMSTVNAK